jgi:benzoate/toluate 1,2-dioxygenase subunit beta
MSDNLSLWHRVASFLNHEAQLLDAGQWQEWLELFAADGVYWIPSRPGQTEARFTPSIVYEDRALLGLRVARLLHPRAYAALPAPRSVHVIGTISADGTGAEVSATSSLVVLHYQDGERRLYGAQARHMLRPRGDSFAIALKRVDLVDCDGIHPVMTLPI